MRVGRGGEHPVQVGRLGQELPGDHGCHRQVGVQLRDDGLREALRAARHRGGDGYPRGGLDAQRIRRGQRRAAGERRVHRCDHAVHQGLADPLDLTYRGGRGQRLKQRLGVLLQTQRELAVRVGEQRQDLPEIGRPALGRCDQRDIKRMGGWVEGELGEPRYRERLQLRPQERRPGVLELGDPLPVDPDGLDLHRPYGAAEVQRPRNGRALQQAQYEVVDIRRRPGRRQVRDLLDQRLDQLAQGRGHREHSCLGLALRGVGLEPQARDHGQDAVRLVPAAQRRHRATRAQVPGDELAQVGVGLGVARDRVEHLGEVVART